VSLFSELKRRNVFRVAIAYLAAAWLVTEVGGTVLPAFGYGESELRIIIIVLAIAFVPVLVLSWVFEFTPAGLTREVGVDREQSITRYSGKRIDRLIVALLALGLGYFALDKFVIEPRRVAEIVEETAQQVRSEALVESYGEKSIAVLPFVNMSADPQQEYFSDGISEELLNLLARIPKLRVISRSSSFYYKGKGVRLADIARELNVAHVLEGSVRHDGDRVRITAQLIEARSDTHLWSQTYDRTLDSIFAVQDEIAAAISAALEMELALTGAEAVQLSSVKTANTAAYDAYLEGRELIRRRGREEMENAVSHLQLAVRLDDSFAPAHAQLAMATMMHSSYVATDRVEARSKAIRHLDRAQALAPDLAEVYAGRALLAKYADDPETMIAHAQKALTLNPSYVDAMEWLHQALYRLGHYEQAHSVLEKMLETDPLSISARMNYASWLMERGLLAEAHEMAETLHAQSPQAAYRTHADISFWAEGKLAESLAWGLRASRDNWYASSAFTLVGLYDEAHRINDDYWIDANQGRWDEAVQASQRKVQLYPDSGIRTADAAEILYRAGRLEEALPLYERALALAPKGLAIHGGFGPYFTIQLAFLQRREGNEEAAQATAEIARQAYAERRAAGEIGPVQFQTESLIAAFDRDRDRAMSALESALQIGFRWPLFLEDPMFDELRQEPRFVALQEELHSLLAAEQKRVLQLICFNNPVPDEWQPMPETCEGVANLQ
jgi:TolB-like protein/Tfp pilus assembly protein PilF